MHLLNRSATCSFILLLSDLQVSWGDLYVRVVVPVMSARVTCPIARRPITRLYVLTMRRHERNRVSDQRQLDYLFNTVLRLTSMKTSKSTASLTFCGGIHRLDRMESFHKGQQCGNSFYSITSSSGYLTARYQCIIQNILFWADSEGTPSVHNMVAF